MLWCRVTNVTDEGFTSLVKVSQKYFIEYCQEKHLNYTESIVEELHHPTQLLHNICP